MAEPPVDYRVSPSDKSNMAKYLFGGFERCLYPVQKFDSDAERKLAVILERDASNGSSPPRVSFRSSTGTERITSNTSRTSSLRRDDTIYMLEPKASNQMDDPIVLAKKDAAMKWCANASTHALSCGGKPWRYLLIPHDEIATNIMLDALADRFGHMFPR